MWRTDYNTLMGNEFRPEHRVRKQADFDRVYAARVFAADGVLIVNAAENGLPHARLGLSIGRIVGKAVVRNRWKRLIREAFRLSRSDLPPGFDFVVRPQKAAIAEFEPIRESLVALTIKIAKRLAKSSRNSTSREQTCSRNTAE
jgi:ribonuclease P protein component